MKLISYLPATTVELKHNRFSFAFTKHKYFGKCLIIWESFIVFGMKHMKESFVISIHSSVSLEFHWQDRQPLSISVCIIWKFNCFPIQKRENWMQKYLFPLQRIRIRQFPFLLILKFTESENQQGIWLYAISENCFTYTNVLQSNKLQFASRSRIGLFSLTLLNNEVNRFHISKQKISITDYLSCTKSMLTSFVKSETKCETEYTI